ncbi:tyrosine-type recombinase/integrase [Nocardia sp. NPDC004151]|uniref:tyrosine-type recombinase/integrase n=1 Tax=Nocardia sp. NPDC004151 TaxID=3364304 RepID=UPI00369927DF
MAERQRDEGETGSPNSDHRGATADCIDSDHSGTRASRRRSRNEERRHGHSGGGVPCNARLLVGPRGGRIRYTVPRRATHEDEVVAELGYEHLRRHALRRAGLTWFANAGVLLHLLREIAGHSDPRVTQLYLHPYNAAFPQAGDLLSLHLEAPKRPPVGHHLRGVKCKEIPFRPGRKGIFLVGLAGFEPATT